MPRVAKIKCIICGRGSIKAGEMICSNPKCHSTLKEATVKERQLIVQLFGIYKKNLLDPIWKAKELEAQRKPVIDQILRAIKNRAIARSKDLIAKLKKSLQEPSLHEEPIKPVGQLTIGWPSEVQSAISKPSIGLSKVPSFHEELHTLDNVSINENPLYEDDPKEPVVVSEELLDYDDIIEDPMDCD